jgi:hypothetical protein
MIYPQKLSSKKGEIVLKTLMVSSVLLGIILFIINKLTTPNIRWAALANCGIIYTWITVIYSIKRGTNIAGHVLIQTITTSVVVLYIDDRIGFRGWSLNIAIPIILIVANITMLVLTIVTHKNYIKYAIYQLIIVLITLVSMWLILEQIIKLRILSNITIIVSFINLLLSLILCFKDVKEALIRKLHM